MSDAAIRLDETAHCANCGSPLALCVLDLGEQPLANAVLSWPGAPDPRYPLRAMLCEVCLFLQAPSVVPASAIFSDYPYFSSISPAFVAQCGEFAGQVTERLGLGPQSRVIEAASNDGYLLQHFAKAGIPCLGIEPAENVALVAREQGIPTETLFLGAKTASQIVAVGGQADLVIANNVIAHVPDINDFVRGLGRLLKPEGVVTIEFPWLLHLIEQVQFDTIYHEHRYYLSAAVLRRILARHGLRIFDIEEIPSHGGSLRVWACRTGSHWMTQWTVAAKMGRETAAGLNHVETYGRFADSVKGVLGNFRAWLDANEGKRIAAFGAAAKGATFLNAAGVSRELICVGDDTPAKQGRYIPGCHLPIVSAEAMVAAKPDLVLILPWNWAPQIAHRLADILPANVELVTAVPEIRQVPAHGRAR